MPKRTTTADKGNQAARDGDVAVEPEHLMEMVRHSSRVASLCLLLGAKAGDVDLCTLHICALLHDIGKLSIPETILLKPGKLTPAEFDQVKRHTELGRNQIRAIIATLEAAAETAMQHHERYGDGKGYHGLRGEEIQPFARIVGLCDAFDALMSRRPYKEPWELQDALDYVRENAGIQFDPYWAELLLECKGALASFYDRKGEEIQ